MSVAAGLPRRLAAFGVDYIVIAAYMAVLTAVSFALGGGSGGPADDWFRDPVTAQVLGFLTLTLPVGAYFALFETSRRQATPGKRLLRIRVDAQDGGRLGTARGFVRSAGKLLPWEIAHGALRHSWGSPTAADTIPTGATVALIVAWILVALYCVLPALTRSRQTPYDRLAGSVVVRDGSSPTG